MKPEILVLGKLMPYVMKGLEERYTLHRAYEAQDRESYLAEVGPRIRGLVTSTFHGLTADDIDACPNLEIISSFGVGTDSLAVGHASNRHIPVCNTPEVLNDDVANMAVALVLATTRNLVANDRYVREGRWAKEGDPPLSRGLAGQKVGIVGMGRIGSSIAHKLGVFGCRIAYHTRTPRTDVPHEHYPDLIALASDSFVLVLIVPGGADTQGMIGREVLDALGPQGILVNVARGSVVDEPELVAALQEGRLGGAGLDVFVDEPNVPDALLGMENVVLQPHQASATQETRRAMGDLVIRNLDAHFAGRPLVTPLG